MFGRRSQHDFEDEIRSHLQMEVERLKAQGMSPADAERLARRSFGNVGVAEDRFYDGQRLAWMQDAGRDLRLAWRSLLRTPGFLVAAVGTLSLAIGAVAGMFNVVNTVMLEPLPFPRSDRLVFLQGTSPGSDLPERYDLGNEFYQHYKENSKLIDGLFTFGAGTSTFRAAERVERIPMAWPSNDMYATLGVRPQVGRLPVSTDNDDAVVISDQLWSSWFGRDPSVIGKWYFVSDSLKQIIGVMPAEFRFPEDETMLWVSGEIRLDQIRAGNPGAPIVARMKDGVTTEQLAGELTRLTKQLPDRFGATPTYTRIIKGHRAIVVPILDRIVGSTLRTSLFVLFGAVSVVLLIACANVANLFLVRAESRRRDLTVRRAIGASRAQLVRFQMAEALAVALASGVLAVVLAGVTLPLFLRAAPQGIPRLGQAGLDAPTFAATFGIVLLVALACGIAPALRASSPDLSALREGGRGSTGARAWGRDLLVIGQTALALVLLIGSALLVESFQRLKNVDPGYDIRDVYTFQYAPEQPGLRDGPSLGRLHLNVMDHSLGALIPCKLAFIQHDDLRALMRNHFHLAGLFWRDTLIDAAVFRQWVVNVGRRQSPARMAHVLCELLVRLRAVELVDDHAFDLPVTQGDLADALGITPVHVNRVLKDLRKQSLIALQGKFLKVLDWEGLQAAGEFDPTYLHLVKKQAR